MARWWMFAVLLGLVLSLSPVQAADPELHVGMRSGSELIADLEFLVAKQGKQPGLFQKKIKDSIEPFLVGVDDKLPVGISFRFDDKHGLRKVIRVPVKIKVVFIDDNLVDAGIDVDAVRGDKTKSFYRLSGEIIAMGWMRLSKDNTYGTIAPKVEADAPADAVTPITLFKDQLADGQDLFFYSLGSPEETPLRLSAFQKIKANRLELLKKNTKETEEAFNLRKLMLVQQIEMFGEIFAGTKELSMSWKTDQITAVGTGKSHWTAHPDTEFGKWVAAAATGKSVFGSYPVPENAVFSMRLLLPLSESTIKNAREVYKLSPAVLKQRISEEADLSFDEKAARIALSEAGIQALDAGLNLGVVDAYHDIAPSSEGKHTFLLGFRTADIRTQMETIVTNLGKVRAGWSSQVKTETDGEIHFHTFKTANPPKLLLDFYGGDGTVYVAAGPAFLGFATGEGSLDRLKALATLATTGEPKALEHLVDIQFHAKKTLEVTDAFMSVKDFDLLQILQNTGLTRDPARANEEQPARNERAEGRTQKPDDALGILKNMEWRQMALKAMTGDDDLVTFRLTLVNGAIDGSVQVQPTVFAGVGSVLAELVKKMIP